MTAPEYPKWLALVMVPAGIVIALFATFALGVFVITHDHILMTEMALGVLAAYSLLTFGARWAVWATHRSAKFLKRDADKSRAKGG